jgi:hypothetical protein
MPHRQFQMIERNVNLAVRNIRKSVKLGRLFDQIHSEPKRYLASHSVALAYLSRRHFSL